MSTQLIQPNSSGLQLYTRVTFIDAILYLCTQGCVLGLFLQESYAMLNRYELLVAKEESERVDTLRYSWQKLQSLAVSALMTIC